MARVFLTTKTSACPRSAFLTAISSDALTFDRLVTARTGNFLASSATLSTVATFFGLGSCSWTWTVLLILLYCLFCGLPHRRLDHYRLHVLVPVGELP